MALSDVSQQPKSVPRLRIAQAVLAIFVLGLTAYLQYYYNGDIRIIVPIVAVSDFA